MHSKITGGTIIIVSGVDMTSKSAIEGYANIERWKKPPREERLHSMHTAGSYVPIEAMVSSKFHGIHREGSLNTSEEYL